MHHSPFDLSRALHTHTSWDVVATLTMTDRDPLTILDEQKRLSDMLPLRAERMGVGPFTFNRGTAAVQVAHPDRGKNPHEPH